MVVVSLTAVIATTWILALQTDTQNSFGAAILMTLVALGVLGIYWILARAIDGQKF